MVNKNQKQLLGISALVLAGFFYSLFGVFTRYVIRDLGFYYQSVSRYFVGAIIFSLLVYSFRSYKRIKKHDWKWFFLISVFAVATNIPFYLAVNNLPLGTALFLFYALSLITSYLFGYFALKERLNLIKIIALFLAMVGIYFIYQGNFSVSQPIYLLAAILSGAFFGLYSSTSKKINLKYSSLQINFVSYILIFLLTTPFMVINKESVNLNFFSFSWFMNILYATAMLISGFFTVYGLKYIEAQKGSLILLSELIFVVINGFIFFKEIPGLAVVIGGIFILVALILPNVNLRQKHLSY